MKNCCGLAGSIAALKLKLPVGPKTPVPTLVQVFKGAETSGVASTWKGPLAKPFTPLTVNVLPDWASPVICGWGWIALFSTRPIVRVGGSLVGTAVGRAG